jgi:hypothetical protein
MTAHGLSCLSKTAHISAAMEDRAHILRLHEVAASRASPAKSRTPGQEFHKSADLCPCSQLPLASSHSSRERTLARANAIAQSAAP